MESIHQYPLILLNIPILGSEFGNDLEDLVAFGRVKDFGSKFLLKLYSVHCTDGKGCMTVSSKSDFFQENHHVHCQETG